MTVADLIAALQAFPGDARVLVSGYEGGLDDPEPPVLETELVTYTDRTYFGQYDRVDDTADAVAQVPRFAAVILERPRP